MTRSQLRDVCGLACSTAGGRWVAGTSRTRTPPPCSSGTMSFSLFPWHWSSAGRGCAGTGGRDGGRCVGIRVTGLWLTNQKGLGNLAPLSFFRFYTQERRPGRHSPGHRPAGTSTVDRGALPETAHPGHTQPSAGGGPLTRAVNRTLSRLAPEPAPNARRLNTPPGSSLGCVPPRNVG